MVIRMMKRIVDVAKTNLLAAIRNVSQLSTVVMDSPTAVIPAMKMLACAKVILVYGVLFLFS